MTNGNPKDVMTAEPIVQRLHRLAAVGRLATEEDLAELQRMMEAEQEEFVEWVEGRLYPNPVAACGEYALRYLQVCMLVRLGFEPYEMNNLLGVGATNLCNIRRRLLKRLFGMEGTPKAFDRRILSMTKAPSNLPRLGEAGKRCL